MKQIVIFPGKFQPPMPHHIEVFKQLESQFPNSEVYLASTNKVDATIAPFSFEEKAQISHFLGLPKGKIIKINKLYEKDEYINLFDNDCALVFAIDKENAQRFSFDNMRNSGINMTKGGDPAYVQKINTFYEDQRPMTERAYVTIAPSIRVDKYRASTTAFREALQAAPDVDAAIENFTSFYGQFNQEVFSLVYNKLTDAIVLEDLYDMRKMAGLLENEEELPPWIIHSELDVFGTDQDGGEKEMSMRFSYNTRTKEITLLDNPDHYHGVYYDENDVIDQIKAELELNEPQESRGAVLRGIPISVGPKEPLETGTKDPFKLDLSSVRRDFGI